MNKVINKVDSPGGGGGRNRTIDILRCIGILLVILAHTEPPLWVMATQFFNVSLLVFVSGLSYSGRKISFNRSFLFQRFERLIIPLWMFLVVYITFILLFNSLEIIAYDYTKKEIIESFFLMNGFGYVWIYRVFFMIGLATPLLLRVATVNKERVFVSILLLFFLLQFIPLHFELLLDEKWFRATYYYFGGYSIIFMLAARLLQRGLSYLRLCLIFFMALFCISYLLFGPYTININFLYNSKYPPHLLYIIYGIVISILLYLVLNRLPQDFFGSRLVNFIGKNSNWCYFYHIPIVEYFKHVEIYCGLKYIIAVTIAILLTYFQVSLVNKSGRRCFVSKYLVG